MGPGVVPDFMPFRDDAAHDVRIHLHLAADEEEGALDVPCLQQIEQLRSQRRVRTVVKSHRQHLLVRLHAAVGNAHAGGRRGGQGGGGIELPRDRIGHILRRGRRRVFKRDGAAHLIAGDGGDAGVFLVVAGAARLGAEEKAEPEAEIHAWGGHRGGE